MTSINKSYADYYWAIKNYSHNPYQTNALGTIGQYENRNTNSVRSSGELLVSPASVIHILPETRKP